MRMGDGELGLDRPHGDIDVSCRSLTCFQLLVIHCQCTVSNMQIAEPIRCDIDRIMNLRAQGLDTSGARLRWSARRGLDDGLVACHCDLAKF